MMKFMPEDTDAVDETGDDDEVPPLLVLATAGDLVGWLPDDVRARHRGRPVWVMVASDAEQMELFERIPEDPLPRGAVDALLGGLRRFVADKSDALQALLGATDSLEFGFHADADLEEVRESFEDDGFFVVGTIEEGEVVESIDEDP
jgi:hypothetical protein